MGTVTNGVLFNLGSFVGELAKPFAVTVVSLPNVGEDMAQCPAEIILKCGDGTSYTIQVCGINVYGGILVE